jgi:hypothetical protein
MAANSNRSLTLSIVADIDNLQKGLKKADTEIETFGDKVGAFGKKAAAAFAIAAAAAVAYGTKLAVDGVKAAIEDEQAQLRLANALKAATGATDAQIKATEDMILKTSLATGVADDKLRPALQRLAVSTKDTEEAQKLLSLALDISKGSGKDLESVANALGKAQDGNTTALGRLGLGLSKAELSTLSFTEVQDKLSDLYGGAAADNAETFQGKIDRLKVGFDEAKESLGVALLPQVEKFITFLNTSGIPTLNAFIAGLTGTGGMSDALTTTEKNAELFGKGITGLVGLISGFITFLREAIGLLTSFANQLISVANVVPGVNIGSIPNIAPSMAPSVPQTSGLSSLGVNPNAPVTTINNITVQALDSESAARAVNKVITQSSKRSIPALDGASIRRFQQ